MLNFLRNILLITTLFVPFCAYAETVTLPRAANIRSSRTFYGTENVLSQLPKDAQIEILSRRDLRSGAEALEIKIVAPADRVSLNEKSPIYIWQSKEEVKNKGFMEAGVTCVSCNANNSTIPASVKDIQNITNKIEEQQSLEPVAETADCPSVEKIQAYSNSPQVAKSIQWAKDHRRAKSGGLCYRHTKEILATQTKGGTGPGKNLIPKWFSTPSPASARKGAAELMKYGFKNLLSCPQYKNEIIGDSKVNLEKIPSGAVLIYSRDGNPGHAEMKFTDPVDGKSKYTYGPILEFPVNRGLLGNKYKLIGVMVKP